MKKWITRLSVGTLAAVLCTASVYAAGGGHGICLNLRDCSAGLCTAQSCRGDADGDGLCDVCGLEAGSGHVCRRDADGDGLCDVCGLEVGSCGCLGGRQGCAQTGTGAGGHHGRCGGGHC